MTYITTLHHYFLTPVIIRISKNEFEMPMVTAYPLKYCTQFFAFSNTLQNLLKAVQFGYLIIKNGVVNTLAFSLSTFPF